MPTGDEDFDGDHPPEVTPGTAIEGLAGQRFIACLPVRSFLKLSAGTGGWMEQAATRGEFPGAIAVAQQAIVSQACKSAEFDRAHDASLIRG